MHSLLKHRTEPVAYQQDGGDIVISVMATLLKECKAN